MKYIFVVLLTTIFLQTKAQHDGDTGRAIKVPYLAVNMDTPSITSIPISAPNFSGGWLKQKIDSELIRKGDILLIPMTFGMKIGDPIRLGDRVYVLRGYYPVYAPTDITGKPPEMKPILSDSVQKYILKAPYWSY